MKVCHFIIYLGREKRKRLTVSRGLWAANATQISLAYINFCILDCSCILTIESYLRFGDELSGIIFFFVASLAFRTVFSSEFIMRALTGFFPISFPDNRQLNRPHPCNSITVAKIIYTYKPQKWTLILFPYCTAGNFVLNLLSQQNVEHPGWGARNLSTKHYYNGKKDYVYCSCVGNKLLLRLGGINIKCMESVSKKLKHGRW